MSTKRSASISKVVSPRKRQECAVRKMDRRKPRQSEATLLVFRVMAIDPISARWAIGKEYMLYGNDGEPYNVMVQLVAKVRPSQLSRYGREYRKRGIVKAKHDQKNASVIAAYWVGPKRPVSAEIPEYGDRIGSGTRRLPYRK